MAQRVAPKGSKTSVVRRRRTQEERSAETRTKLVRATIRLLCERDVNDIGTPAIAEAAGVSRGALQHHFSSKNELLVAAVGEIADELHQQLAVTQLPGLPVKERVDLFVDRYWEVLGGSPIYTAVMKVGLNAKSNPVLERLISERLDEVSKAREIEWVRVFADSPLETEKLARVRNLMIYTLRGFAVWKILHGATPHMEEEIALAKRLLIHAIETPELRREEEPQVQSALRVSAR